MMGEVQANNIRDESRPSLHQPCGKGKCENPQIFIWVWESGIWQAGTGNGPKLEAPNSERYSNRRAVGGRPQSV